MFIEKSSENSAMTISHWIRCGGTSNMMATASSTKGVEIVNLNFMGDGFVCCFSEAFSEMV